MSKQDSQCTVCKSTTPHQPGPARPVTIDVGAERAGVSGRTVRRWIADGRLRAYRLAGHLLRVDLDDIDALYTRV